MPLNFTPGVLKPLIAFLELQGKKQPKIILSLAQELLAKIEKLENLTDEFSEKELLFLAKQSPEYNPNLSLLAFALAEIKRNKNEKSS